MLQLRIEEKKNCVLEENHSEKVSSSIAIFVRGAVYMSFYQMDFSVLCMFGTWKYFYDYLAN